MTALLVLVWLALAPQGAEDIARWTAGEPPVEQNIRLVRSAPVDGDPRSEVHLAVPCLRTDSASNNGYIYFDVSRQWLRRHGHPPYRVELTVEYLDEGTDSLAVQYDAIGAGLEANFRETAWRKTGTGRWLTRTLELPDAEFSNAQQGQADFRIAAGMDGDERIAGVVLRVLSASPRPPRRPPLPSPEFPKVHERAIAIRRVELLLARTPNAAERIAIERLRTRLSLVGAREGEARSSSRTGAARLVIGRWNRALAARYPRTARLIDRLGREKPSFRRRDGYVLCLERGGGSPVVCAVALESPGAAFAVGRLHSTATRGARGPLLYLPQTDGVEAPAFDRRELYLNIGYGLARPGITVESWTLKDWKRYIDALVLARYNAWSFFLWSDSGMIHPVARANRALNLKLHATLRHAIAYAQRRGMRVGMQFVPSMLPIEVWNAHPELRAQLEYHYPGTVCPSRPESMQWMREVHGMQLRWFRNVDFVSLWFYDVGGCFCETCRVPARQLQSLHEQVRTFATMWREINPRAGFQVMAWAIWRYEQKHNYRIRGQFVEETRQWFAERGWPLTMADGIYVDAGCTPLFPHFRAARLPAASFLYQTNIETGQPFPLLLTRYLARWLPASLRAGATSAFLMRMEAGTKLADDCVAGAYLWNPGIAAESALRDCARRMTADERAGRHAWEALKRMDDFAWFGYAGGAATQENGRTIERLARLAVDYAPHAIRPDLEWLRVSGAAYAILGAAAEAREEEDQAAIASLDARFAVLMRGSPLFRHQADGAPYWRDLFRTALVRYFHSGWAAYHF